MSAVLSPSKVTSNAQEHSRARLEDLSTATEQPFHKAVLQFSSKVVADVRYQVGNVFDALRGRHSIPLTAHKVDEFLSKGLDAFKNSFKDGKKALDAKITSDPQAAEIYKHLQGKLTEAYKDSSNSLESAIKSDAWKQATEIFRSLAKTTTGESRVQMLKRAMWHDPFVKEQATWLRKVGESSKATLIDALKKVAEVVKSVENLQTVVKEQRHLVDPAAITFKASQKLNNAAVKWAVATRASQATGLYTEAKDLILNDKGEVELNDAQKAYVDERTATREALSEIAKMIAPYHVKGDANVLNKLEVVLKDDPETFKDVKKAFDVRVEQVEARMASIFTKKEDGAIPTPADVKASLARFDNDFKVLEAFTKSIEAAPKSTVKISELFEGLLAASHHDIEDLSLTKLPERECAQIMKIWSDATVAVAEKIRDFAVSDELVTDEEQANVKESLEMIQLAARDLLEELVGEIQDIATLNRRENQKTTYFNTAIKHFEEDLKDILEGQADISRAA